MPMNQKQQLAAVLEYQAWRQVDVLLRHTGAVTAEDSNAGPNDLPNSPGKALYRAIRKWGAAFSKMQREDHR